MLGESAGVSSESDIEPVTHPGLTLTITLLAQLASIKFMVFIGTYCATTSSSESAVVTDIGKLLHLRRDIHKLGNEEKYRILTTEPNPDPSVYPRTHPYNS